MNRPVSKLRCYDFKGHGFISHGFISHGFTSHGSKNPFKSYSVKNRGFTLIEMLVVVLVISIIITFASLSVGQHGDRTVEEEAKRIYYLLGLASEEAVLQGSSMAMLIRKSGYEFAKIEGDKLVPIKDSVFRKRDFPDELRLELEYQGEPASFEDDKNPPRVYVFSSGEMTEFTLKLKFFDTEPYTVRANFLGQVRLVAPGAEDGSDV